jgi:hypothetical protein
MMGHCENIDDRCFKLEVERLSFAVVTLSPDGVYGFMKCVQGGS